MCRGYAPVASLLDCLWCACSFRPVEFLFHKWLSARAVTGKEKEEAVIRFPFEWGTQNAIQLSVFTLVLVLGTMMPLMLPYGVAYFAVKHLTDKWVLNHQLADMFDDVHVHPTQLEEYHAWSIDQEEEVARRSEGGSELARPGISTRSRTPSRDSAESPSPRHTRSSSAAKAAAAVQRRSTRLPLDPRTHGPLSHYAGRIAHHTYTLVPFSLILYSVG